MVSEELATPAPALWVLLSLQTGTLQINSVFIIPAILMGVSKVTRAFVGLIIFLEQC